MKTELWSWSTWSEQTCLTSHIIFSPCCETTLIVLFHFSRFVLEHQHFRKAEPSEISRQTFPDIYFCFLMRVLMCLSCTGLNQDTVTENFSDSLHFVSVVLTPFFPEPSGSSSSLIFPNSSCGDAAAAAVKQEGHKTWERTFL